MEPMTLSQAMAVSWVMPVLLVLSILVLGQALERAYVFWVTQRLPTEVWDRVRSHLEEGDKTGALNAARKSKGTVAQAFARLLSLPQPGMEQLVENFQLYRQRLQMDLNRRLGFFGTASFISPLIGLLGTVLGIMRAFHDLAAAGAGGPAVVAAGISEALIATACGIGLAVFSAVCYNYFTMAVRHRLNTVDLWMLELSQLLSGAK
ncbi:MAG: MotA/TolQ/ExbB proton channel family protein [Elusimicrobia bacterium]|nr:MotA/TolQ/ExbB proton channel family protein [Elusimicrobiota bacterium]